MSVIGREAEFNVVESLPDSVLKCIKRQEFVVVGYTESKGQSGGIGALLLGVYDDVGQLYYVGQVGTGFDKKTAGILEEKLSLLKVAETPLSEKPRNLKGIWVKPEHVAEVSFAEWTREGTVAAYSARARPGIGVSMPCAWDELSVLTGGAHWTITNARKRLESSENPWENYIKTKQILRAAIKKIFLH